MNLSDLVKTKLSANTNAVLETPVTSVDANGIPSEGVTHEYDPGCGEKIAQDVLQKVAADTDLIAAHFGDKADIFRAAVDAVCLLKCAGILGDTERVLPAVQLNTPSDYISLAAQIADRALLSLKA